MDFLVGCPVWGREWILPQWFEHIEKAFEKINQVPSYVFVVDEERDSGTLDCIKSHTKDRFVVVTHVSERFHSRDTFKRDWSDERLEWMVDLRNALLKTVRKYHPKFFLSIDSDILLNRCHLESMLTAIPDYDAVGGKVFLGPGSMAPLNYGDFTPSNRMIRGHIDYLGKVEILMALKLMTPKAYNVDYRHDFQGEDIGWSKACREEGLKFAFDGSHVSKHCMSLQELTTFDRRCGY